MIQHLRVGIPIISQDAWQDGFVYVTSLLKGLTLLPPIDRPRLTLIVTDDNLKNFENWRILIHLCDDVIFIGNKVEKLTEEVTVPIISCTSYLEALNIVDFYFPSVMDYWIGKCSATWIPEISRSLTLNHFSLTDMAHFNKLARIAKYAPIILFNSVSTQKKFFNMHPSCQALSCCLPLGIYPEENWSSDNLPAVQLQYGLPNKFVLCCNEFQEYNNWETIFQAIDLLRQMGREVALICATSEKVLQNNAYFQYLIQVAQDRNIKDLVRTIDGVTYQQKIELVRCSSLVIQPSLTEEFDTIIDLCEAFETPIISSDTPIHREKKYGIYFRGIDACQLAANIKECLDSAKPTLCLKIAKQKALAKNRVMVDGFCRLVEQSQLLADKTHFRAYKPNHTNNSSILIATSLAASKDFDNQQRAVRSWQNVGFNVVSINSPNEIALLQPHFPNITFAKAHRDASAEFAKPYIFFDDILSYLAEHGPELCGIINSDIHILDNRLYPFLKREALYSLLYGSRIDVNTLDNLRGRANYYGFDYFFFDRSLIPYYPKSQFCLGLPYWDYWAVLIPLFYRISVKRIVKARIYHVKHPENWHEQLASFEKELDKYITRLTNEALSTHLRDFFCDISTKVSLDMTAVASNKHRNLPIHRSLSPTQDTRIINGFRFMLNRK